MSEIIDHMARAAYEAQRARAGPIPFALLPWDEAPSGLREECRQFMRDGLAAAREPDEAMIEAGRATAVGWLSVWENLIDEALKP